MLEVIIGTERSNIFEFLNILVPTLRHQENLLFLVATFYSTVMATHTMLFLLLVNISQILLDVIDIQTCSTKCSYRLQRFVLLAFPKRSCQSLA